MNFLAFDASVTQGADSVTLGGSLIQMPPLHEAAAGQLELGVRPEHVRLQDEGDFRGRVVASEYLGTTQIISAETPAGMAKARQSSANVVTPGEHFGLHCDARTISLFERESGRALRSTFNDQRVNGHG